MLRSIMQTTFSPPHFHEVILKRNKCYQKFTNNLDKKLIFIKGSAGFGKTILLGELYQGMEENKLWFSIPEFYFGLDKFFVYLFYQSLDLLTAERKEMWESVLEQVLMGFLENDKVVAYLVNLFEEILQTTSRELYIYLDDFQFVQFKELEKDQRLLQMFLRFAPTKVHFVISSRCELPIPLTKFRLEEQLIVIEEKDLALEPDELWEFLDAKGVQLSEEQFNWLYQKTEGWITGISLLLYRMLEMGEVNNGLSLEEYLMEILTGIPEDLQEFLCKTSVFCGVIEPEICDQYLGIQNSELILDKLTESYLLTQRHYVEGKTYYRYHKLLKEHFNRQLDDKQIHMYNLELAMIYRQRQMVELEIIYLIRAYEDQQALQLLKNESRRILASSDINLIMEWLDSMKKEEVDPIMEIYRGLLRELKWRHEEALPYYERAEVLLRESGQIIGWVKAQVRIAGIYAFRNDNLKSLEICQMTLPHIPEDECAVLADLYRIMGHAYLGNNQRNRGIECYQKALEYSRCAQDIEKEAFMLNNLALESLLPDGKVTEAKTSFETALHNFRQINNTIGIGFVLCNLAYFWFITNESERAIPLLAEAEEVFLNLTNSNIIRLVWFLQARIEINNYNYKKAEERLSRVEKSLKCTDYAQYSAHYALCKGILLYNLCDDSQAEEWFDKADEYVLELGDGCFAYYEFKIQRMVYYLKRNRYQDVIELAENILNGIQGELDLVRLEVSLLMAVAYQNDTGALPDELSLILNQLEEEDFKFLRAKYKNFLKPITKPVLSGKPVEFDITENVSPTQVWLLGEFRIYYSGSWITEQDWTNRKALDVLKYLILNNNRWVRQDELLDYFWPETDIEKAKQTLYVALYTIRRQWEPDLQKSTESQFLQTKRGMCKFYLPEPYWIDLETFTEFADEGLRLFNERRFSHAEKFLKEAQKLYKDDLLIENIYDEWTQCPREKYLDKYLEVLITLAKIEGENRNFAIAIELLEEALNKNPFLDKVHGQLMGYLIQLGKVNCMIQHYQEYEKIYREELGVEMPEEITRLYLLAKG